MKLRTFLCIDLPEGERERIAALQSRLRRHGARVGWTAPGNVHLTLAFLGDVEQERIPDVSRAATAAATRSAPLALRLEGAGGFPTLSRPRVLWVGIAGETERLAALQSDLTGELEAVGFPRERREFRPHLTIGRVKDDRDRALRALAADLSAEGLSAPEFVATELVVMRSALGPGGARYTPLARAPLGGERRG
jgi:2'-5' RNA ligase